MSTASDDFLQRVLSVLDDVEMRVNCAEERLTSAFDCAKDTALMVINNVYVFCLRSI